MLTGIWTPDINVAATGNDAYVIESDVIYDAVSGWIQGAAKDRHSICLVDGDVTAGNVKVEISQSGATGDYLEVAHIYSPGATQTIQCPILQVVKPEGKVRVTATGTTSWHIRVQGSFRIYTE